VISLLFLEQAKWYLKAAESGYLRAMYNVSLCYSLGEGLVHSHRQARKWMKRAADRGHSKAQFEHGLALFSVCNVSIPFLYILLRKI
jgi:TPR repeat protein